MLAPSRIMVIMQVPWVARSKVLWSEEGVSLRLVPARRSAPKAPNADASVGVAIPR
jgi:hypothetical protein